MGTIAMGTLLALGLFFGSILSIEVGRRIGRKSIEDDAEHAREGLGTIEGAIFGLMGLIIAFTFSGAAGRLDSRKAQIAVEANAIGTAWLRISVLPADAQPAMREKFRQYTDARIELFSDVSDPVRLQRNLDHLNTLGSEIWNLTMTATKALGNSPFSGLFLIAVNDMLDQATIRNASARIHPPLIIHVLLAGLAIICSLLTGHGMAAAKNRSHFHIVCFALMVSTVTYVILELEYPRIGIIRISSADKVMLDQRASMN